MTGNALWLVCNHHPDRTEAIQLGRRVSGPYSRAPHKEKLEEFFERHKHCGGGFDHFTVAFDRAKDHDLPKDNPLANGIHLALTEAANS